MTMYWGMGPFTDDLTNVLFEDADFSDANFLQGEGLIVPGEDGYVFLGLHVTSEQGYGVFLDDVDIHDWGTVGINPDTEKEQVRIYSYRSNIYINAGELWNGSRIQVVNLMGQVVYEGQYQNKTNIDLQESTPGLYIVNLGNDKNMVSKKLMIN